MIKKKHIKVGMKFNYPNYGSVFTIIKNEGFWVISRTDDYPTVRELQCSVDDIKENGTLVEKAPKKEPALTEVTKEELYDIAKKIHPNLYEEMKDIAIKQQQRTLKEDMKYCRDNNIPFTTITPGRDVDPQQHGKKYDPLQIDDPSVFNKLKSGSSIEIKSDYTGEFDTYLSIPQLVDDIHSNAKAKGFWDEGVSTITEKIMLVVTELAEAVEALRKDKRGNWIAYEDDKVLEKMSNEEFELYIKDTFEDELADAVIRIFDICGKENIDIYRHITEKMKYNEGRERLHGKQF